LPIREWPVDFAADLVEESRKGDVETVSLEAARRDWEAWQGARRRMQQADEASPPLLPPGGWVRVSREDLERFRRCPLQTILARSSVALEEEGPPMEEAPLVQEGEADRGVPNLLLGTALHRVLERWAAGGLTADAEAERGVEAALKEAGAEDDRLDEARNLLLDRLARFLDSPFGDRSRIVAAETPFWVRRGTVVFTGIPDRIDDLGDRLRVVDYKVGHMDERYRFQLRYYAWAVNRCTGRPVEAGLLFLRDEVEWVPAEIDERAFREMDELARAVAEAFESNRFPPRFTACPTCDRAALCPRVPGEVLEQLLQSVEGR
jgi:ATP-dependent exoDNAse (exonuclease V) beta subunit